MWQNIFCIKRDVLAPGNSRNSVTIRKHGSLHGPVSPDLFHEYQGRFTAVATDISRGDVNNLSDDEKETIDIILKDYGELEAYTLRELSHKESPWKDARGNLPEGAKCQKVITKASMIEYYRSL